jgi:hypothetical protein
VIEVRIEKNYSDEFNMAAKQEATGKEEEF